MAQLKKPTVKNPGLVSAMADFKQQQNQQNEEAMLKEIQAANFIAPIQLRSDLKDSEPDENGQRQVQASLLAVTNKNGDKFFPAFTDWLEFLKWKNDPEAETMVITFDQYCDILLKQGIEISGIVINPAEANIVMQRNKMAEIKGVTPPPTANAAAPSAAPNHKITALFGTEAITNPNVIIAADRFRKENTPQAQSMFFDSLRKARFVAPAIMRDLPKTAKPGEKLTAQAEFIMIKNEDKQFLPLFTSLPELQKWRGAPDCQAVPMNLSHYTAMLSDPKNTAAGIVIDPFTIGVAFTKDQLLHINPRLQIQELKNIPLDMLGKLKEYFDTVPEIQKAYLNGIKANDEDGFLVILELSEKMDVRQFGEAVSGITKEYGSVVVAPTDSPLGEKAIEGKAPFYEA